MARRPSSTLTAQISDPYIREGLVHFKSNCVTEVEWDDTHLWAEVEGQKSEEMLAAELDYDANRNLSELRRRLAPAMLRRDRRRVRDQLPDRSEQRLDLALTPKQQGLPLRDLVRMNVEPLRQLNQGLVALDGGQRHFGP